MFFLFESPLHIVLHEGKLHEIDKRQKKTGTVLELSCYSFFWGGETTPV